MSLPSHADCRDCPLWDGCRSPGLPSRPWDGGNTGKTKAVLMLGKAPAVFEDQQGKVFARDPSGRVVTAGQITNDLYVGGVDLNAVADIYLGNVVRCKLPNPQAALPQPSTRACRPKWEADVQLLSQRYSEVVILCTGAEAILAVLGRKTSFQKFRQGQKVTIGGQQYAVFATYMASYLVPSGGACDPSKAEAVEAHLLLMKRYLETGALEAEIKVDVAAVDRRSRIPPNAALVSLDIETYGCVASFPRQRFFHPQKSLHWDGVHRSDLVLTCAAAWRDPQDGSLQHRFYNLTRCRDIDTLVDDLGSLERPVLLGQNLPFDVMYLRAWRPEFQVLLEIFGRTQLIDMSVTNFLDSDVRPERTLKAVSRLLGTCNFDGEIDLRKGERYPSVNDPRLAAYNVEDALATLRNYEKLRLTTAEKYGADSPKLSAETFAWYSDELWLAISMMEQGITCDTAKLRRLHDRLRYRVAKLEECAYLRGGVFLGRQNLSPRVAAKLKEADREANRIKRLLKRYEGTGETPTIAIPPPHGPKAYADDLAFRAVQTLRLAGDRRVARTTVGKAIACDKNNINLFLGAAKRGTDLRSELCVLRAFRGYRDCMGRFTAPMLGLKTDTPKDLNNSLIDGRAFPTWRIVPSASDDSDEAGGTQQGRMTAKGPPAQTYPDEIEACECSRYPGGALISVDESQIELRVPAGFSWDPLMEADFIAGINRHASTAEVLAGRPIDKDKDPGLYHLGKTVNFLAAFWGGARGLQETAQRICGISMTLNEAQAIIDNNRARHHRYYAWQRSLVAEVKRKHHLELPYLGISRTFLGTSATVDTVWLSTIVNFPVQTTAALLTISAQVAAERWLLQQGLRTRLVKNTYDEGVYDAPADEVAVVAAELPRFYKHPPLLKLLVEKFGFNPKVPLDCAVKVVYNGHINKHQHPNPSRGDPLP